jgi:TolA-binding protein
VACILFVSTLLLAADGDRGERLLEQGKIDFRNGNFNEAIQDFREVILDPDLSAFHGTCYFWIAKSYMATEQYEKAEKNLEFFIMNYEDHELYPESLYQKGRLLYLQQEYEKSIQILYNFIDTFPDNPYVANAYYWVGESLYSLGHLEKAETIFTYVVQKFPASYKVEAAKYRISVIKMKYREEELLKFLRWSHEEALKALEEFRIREKTYEQALAAYQQKLSKYAEEGVETSIREMETELEEKKQKIQTLQSKIEDLQGIIDSLEKTSAESSSTVSREETASAPPSTVLEKKRELLNLKEQALQLKQFYIRQLEDNLEQ